MFISACSAVNDDLAKIVIPSSKCNSIIGPADDIPFSDATIIWASFYHLMFKEDPEKMRRPNILLMLRKVAKAFGIWINYFSISKESKEGYKRKLIGSRPRRIIKKLGKK